MWSLDCLGQPPAWHQKDPAQLGSCTPLLSGLCWAATICQALFTDAEGRDGSCTIFLGGQVLHQAWCTGVCGALVGDGDGGLQEEGSAWVQVLTWAEWDWSAMIQGERRQMKAQVTVVQGVRGLAGRVSSWNFALGTIEPLRDFKQGSKELRLTIQLNHFCFSVENRLQRGKAYVEEWLGVFYTHPGERQHCPEQGLILENFMTGYRW